MRKIKSILKSLGFKKEFNWAVNGFMYTRDGESTWQDSEIVVLYGDEDWSYSSPYVEKDGSTIGSLINCLNQYAYNTHKESVDG